MSATDDMNEFGPLAGEYVLGTLDADERADVARRRATEPALDAAIVAWERRLGGMLDEVEGVAPPAGLFDAIDARVAGSLSAGPVTPTPTLAITPEEDPRRASAAAAPDNNVVRLRRRVAVWRGAAIAASLALVGLVGVLTYRPALIGELAGLQPADQRFVAVFQDDDVAPRFVMSVDLDTRQVTIRPIRAEALADKSYQLWVVSDTLPPGPQSLGLLEGADRPTRKVLDNLTPAALQNALFGISVEPVGGSPTGKPTGTAIHGTLIPTDTDAPK